MLFAVTWTDLERVTRSERSRSSDGVSVQPLTGFLLRPLLAVFLVALSPWCIWNCVSGDRVDTLQGRKLDPR